MGGNSVLWIVGTLKIDSIFKVVSKKRTTPENFNSLNLGRRNSYNNVVKFQVGLSRLQLMENPIQVVLWKKKLAP